MSETPVDDPGFEADDDGDDAVIGSAFQRSLIVLAGLAVIGVLGWWVSREPAPVEVVLPKRIEAPAAAPPPPAERPPVVPFTDITRRSGIDFVHENGAAGEKLLPETMGSGAAFFDADGDGDPDLLLVNATRWPDDPREPLARPPTLALYLNDDGFFRDVTAVSGLAVGLYGTGVAVADADGDGDRDVFVAALGANRYFVNEGDRFREATAEAGLAGAPDGYSTSAGFFDADGDQDLDLFVLDYIHWSPDIDRALAFTLAGLERAYGPPLSFEGAHAHLYRNEGGGRFRDVSAEAGVQVPSELGGAAAKGLGLAFLDADDDGDTDVLVANDTTPNFLFLNRGDGSFEERGALAGTAYDSMGRSTGAMGIDVADLGNDGRLAIAIGNFANEPSSLYVQQDDPLSFVDLSGTVGLGAPSRARLSFGMLFLDVDLDGRLDLLQANGHLEHEIEQVQASQRYRQPAQLFWNAGGRPRVKLSALADDAVGDLATPMVARAASYADIDRDGDLDVLLTEVAGPPRLLRNDQQLGHHWLRVRLEGRAPNTDAIGARVRVEAGGRTQTRYLYPTRGYLSQVEHTLTFGLGETRHIDALSVRWPDGNEQRLPPPVPNQMIVLRQP